MTQHFVSFYAEKGKNPNYHFTFKVHDKKAAYHLLDKFQGLRAAYFVTKDLQGNVISNERIN